MTSQHQKLTTIKKMTRKQQQQRHVCSVTANKYMHDRQSVSQNKGQDVMTFKYEMIRQLLHHLIITRFGEDMNKKKSKKKNK